MITRKEFDSSVNKITEKASFIAQGLEDLWQYVHGLAGRSSPEMRDTLYDIARRIENVQFNGYANPSQLESKMRFHEFYEVLDENEKAKNLDKFCKYERFYENISRMTKDFKEEE